MKLTAAKSALFVFVLLALGTFVAAVPQSSDDGFGGTGLSSPIDSGSSGTDDSSTTSTGDDTTTAGGKSGTDTGTNNDSPSKSPGNTGVDEPSAPPSRSGGSRNIPDLGDANNGDDSATSKSPKGSGKAKDNNDNADNTSNNNDNNNNNNNNRNGKNNNNRNNNEGNNRSNNAKNANTDASSSGDQAGAQETGSTSPDATVPGEDPAGAVNGTKGLNETCTADDECESGLACENGICVKKEDDDKIGKTLGMALGIIVAVMCTGTLVLTGVRLMMKRRRSDHYSKRISELATPGNRATTPSFYHDSSSLVLEKQARNGNYSFKSSESAVSSDSVRPPAQGYVYGAADGYDMDQSYTRTGMPTYTNDQHLYAPNAPANDWAITPTYGAFPNTAASGPNPIPVPQPTMLPTPAMSPIPPRNAQPAADPRSNGSNAFSDLLARELTGGAGDRDSELIMYGGAASQDLTRESMYDASGDQNDGGRYKMNSIYSAYGRDSLYAGTKDTPSVPNVPNLPSQFQKRDNY